MKKLDKLIESAVKAMTPLKEYTDHDFSGAEVISKAMQKKPDSEDMEWIIEHFPNAVKSMSTAQANLKASDASPMKKRMGRYAPMFVHVQYHTIEGDAGQMFSVHQTQYYNSNFKDKPGGEKFNPRVTELYFSQKDPDEKMGVILAVTDEYIKDLKELERQGKLGKRVSESKKPLKENKGQDAATELIAKLRRTLYPKLSDLELDAFKNEMAQHLDATMNENKLNENEIQNLDDLLDQFQDSDYAPSNSSLKDLENFIDFIRDLVSFDPNSSISHMKVTETKMNAKTESIVKRLKEDTEYQKFFKSALKKFDISSPADLKNDKKKKEFFNYVDKNYKAKGE